MSHVKTVSSATNVWHTYFNGYRARIKGIARERNWYYTVRPNTKDSNQWFDGWDKAELDLRRGSSGIQQNPHC